MSEDRSSPDAIAVALRVGAAIEAAGGRYFVGGSLASSLQGEPRATNDIDVVLDLTTAQITGLVAALGEDFEVDEAALGEALAQTRSCNIFYLPVVMKVDLFCLGASPFDVSEFDRRRRLLVRPPDGTLVVKSPEDTVLRKLLWYLDGGSVSDRQWRDVVEVLRVSAAELDRAYLAAWAGRLHLSELLQRAVTDSAT
jgi:hypothetical protein